MAPRSAVTSICQLWSAATARQVANSAERLEGVPRPGPGDCLGDRRRVAGDGEVEVDHVAPQRRVPDRAAGDPNPLPLAQRAAGENHRRRRGESLADTHAGSRGTLAEIPQVTS